MPDLPPEIAVDILSRLPVNSLLRFRCVCKPWCALINSPYFIKMHLNRSIQTRTNFSLVLMHLCKPQVYSVGFESLDRALELDHPLKPEKQVWGSCNGLLCLKTTEEDLVLWNPSTKNHWKLPALPICYPQDVYGFGFDSMSDDYKVVRIGLFHGDNVVIESEVWVYSLKSNSWRRVHDFPHFLPIGGMPGLLASGALHWGVAGSDPESLIIAFDLGVESFRIVPLPDYKDSNFFADIGVLEGCLSMTCNYYQGFDIWVLKEYGVKESWTKLISIKPSNLIGFFDYLKPIAYSKNCENVLIQHDSCRFMWYDLKQNKIDRVEIRDIPDLFDANLCLCSLVPLGARGGSDEKKQAAQDKTKKKNETKKRDDFLSDGFKLVL